MKKQITITLLLILTLTGTICIAQNQTINVQAANANLEILSYSHYTADSNTLAAYTGDLIVVGEAKNTGTSNIGYAYVKGIAYINDTQVAEAQHQVLGNNIEPNQIVPFYLDFLPSNSITGDNSWVANITSVVAYVGFVYNSEPSQYQGLQASSDTSTSSGIYTVTGKVTNTGSQTIGDVRVITTFYDSAGIVINVNYTDVLSDSLVSGSSVSFTAQPVDNFPSINIKSYKVLVQSQIPEGTADDGSSSSGATPTPTATNTATATPTATSTTTPTATPQQNTNQDNIMLIVAAVIIIIIVAVAIVIIFNRRKNTTIPSQPNPQP